MDATHRKDGRKLNTDPLRKVVEIVHVPLTDIHGEQYINDFGEEVQVRKELLECGHIVRIKQDIYGETNAYARRCQECGNDLTTKPFDYASLANKQVCAQCRDIFTKTDLQRFERVYDTITVCPACYEKLAEAKAALDHYQKVLHEAQAEQDNAEWRAYTEARAKVGKFITVYGEAV